MNEILFPILPSTPTYPLYDSEEARAARDSVIRWASGRTPGASQWNDGWSVLPDNPSIRPTKRPRHNPNYTIKSIIIIIYVTTDVNVFKIRIKESAITNPDVTTHLLYKMMSRIAHFTPPSGPWTRLPHHSQHQEPIINSLNIPETYINSIMPPQDHCARLSANQSPTIRTTSETITESATNQKTTVPATSSPTTVMKASSTSPTDRTTSTEPPTTPRRHQHLYHAHLLQHHSDNQHLYPWTTRHTHHPHTTRATAPQNHHITIQYHLTRESLRPQPHPNTNPSPPRHHLTRHNTPITQP
ncbi:hypothetical protein DPMN_012333 [Dreissena polymorpha]|uniref:Uncharacterized protein n=1 Tax=Dreissena polymorpha TaxID=45954 RepID=A0A9D4S189_DREPO|nr:hypothetical protein DPMN_012333 [Dreissena polymorpha]